MTTPVYPVALALDGRECLVVGGGELAREKIEGLLRASAVVRVVSPVVTTEVRRLATDGNIELHERSFRASDLDGIFLAYGADDDRTLNAAVAQAARACGVLINAVDDIPHCDFFAVSIVRRGDLQLAISTAGQSPAFARWCREYLDGHLPPDWGELLDVLAEVRRELRATSIVPSYERWREAITAEVLTRLAHGDREAAKQRIIASLAGERDLASSGANDRDGEVLRREAV